MFCLFGVGSEGRPRVPREHPSSGKKEAAGAGGLPFAPLVEVIEVSTGRRPPRARIYLGRKSGPYHNPSPLSLPSSRRVSSIFHVIRNRLSG